MLSSSQVLSKDNHQRKDKNGNTNGKPKKKKPTCYHCGKPCHTTNICRINIDKSNPKPKFNGYYFTCNKQCHQAHEHRSKVNKLPTTYGFECYCYTCQKYGDKVKDQKSKEKNNWTPKGQGKEPKEDNTINLDYNAWVNFQYYGKYGYIVENCARIHLKGRSSNWKNYGENASL